MLSCLRKLINMLFTSKSVDAEIIGEVQFSKNHTPCFAVKMQGCPTLIEVNAEDIIEKFVDKFSQRDIKTATKISIKYRKYIKLISIEKNIALLLNPRDDSYQLIDLTDTLFLRDIDHESLSAEDAFVLGMMHERLRAKRDKNLLSLAKCSENRIEFKLVK